MFFIIILLSKFIIKRFISISHFYFKILKFINDNSLNSISIKPWKILMINNKISILYLNFFHSTNLIFLISKLAKKLLIFRAIWIYLNFVLKIFFLNFYLFTSSNSLFFIDSFISIISYIETSITNFLLNLYLFLIDLNSINYN